MRPIAGIFGCAAAEWPSKTAYEAASADHSRSGRCSGELKDIAERARKQAVGLLTKRAD